ncbi:RrF2 family transcriptional regulator [Paenibacillus cellulositrophicus]|uniref:RrF2 family transcriptional regulator n=1 Tax=Paenibacillus cellulositrophicus TaxID=562959 RepID=UPI0012673479|nr:Rrf2 family transcriptional regulator [Paenibacillus cellulositrophicus]
MQYSIGVEYALHCLVYLIDLPLDSPIGIKELSAYQGLSETYLSKIFGKLSKAGIVDSVPGVKGGYKLAKSPDAITFWDVVTAVEGDQPIFQCQNIKDKNYFYRSKENNDACASCTPSDCLINMVMLDAEEKMRDSLRSRTLQWMNEELERTLPKETREDARAYFKKNNKVK